jgi:solute carrier family 10 (sodium/bile acid cotransporter), member 7
LRNLLTGHRFVVGLLIATALAFLFPDAGARGGLLRTEVTTKIGVALIFLFQGLSIAPHALRLGAMRWRLHTATQLFIFVAFPMGALLILRVAGGMFTDELRTGFLFLAVLPTTVSMCVVLTAAAGGNVSGAIFNAALANIAGVVITPLLVALLIGARAEGPGLLPMMGEIAGLLLLPLLAGQLLQQLVRRARTLDRVLLVTLSNAIILFIVYAAFANSVRSGAFAEAGGLATLLVVATAAAVFAIATAAAALTGRWLGLSGADRRAFLFCAPQKTLAAGAPMGQILFAGHPGLGLILLPLMVYHVVQLLAGASMADAMARSPAD